MVVEKIFVISGSRSTSVMLDLRVLQDFADGQAVAAAEDEYAARGGKRGESGMDQRFVIAIFVARAELEVGVEEEADVVFPAGEDDTLVARVAREDDFVGVEVVFGGGGDSLGACRRRATATSTATRREARAWRRIDRANRKVVQSATATLMSPKSMRGADQAEARDEHDREEQGCAERAEIVEGEDVGDEVAEIVAVFQDAHQQRDFETDEDADHDDQRVEDEAEALRCRRTRGRAADEKPPIRPTISSIQMKRATRPRLMKRDRELPMPMANR